jgi:hypothetical protein
MNHYAYELLSLIYDMIHASPGYLVVKTSEWPRRLNAREDLIFLWETRGMGRLQ